MAEPAQPVLPTCKCCGHLLRTAEELQRAYCQRCPPLAAEQASEEERFCCQSDPPCPTCPYVVGWDE